MEIRKLARPLDTLGEGSYSYTVTQTRRIVTNRSERSSSTTTYKVSIFRFHDQFIQKWFYFQQCILNYAYQKYFTTSQRLKIPDPCSLFHFFNQFYTTSSYIGPIRSYKNVSFT